MNSSENSSLVTEVDVEENTSADEPIKSNLSTNINNQSMFSKHKYLITIGIVVVIVFIILIVFFTSRSGFKPDQPRTGPQSDFDLDSSLQKLIARQEAALRKKISRDIY